MFVVLCGDGDRVQVSGRRVGGQGWGRGWGRERGCSWRLGLEVGVWSGISSLLTCEPKIEWSKKLSSLESKI